MEISPFTRIILGLSLDNMPGRNIVKRYIGGGFYHVYNRGVDKRAIFMDDKDYKKFMKFLAESLKKTNVTLLCFVLMPNHFHLIIKQRESRDLEKMMRSLLTRYVLYFNHRHDRSGRLFQGTYRARLIEDNTDLICTSAYIHNNPRKDNPRIILSEYPHSSYMSYVEAIKGYDFVDTTILNSALTGEAYINFVDRMLPNEVDLG